VSSADFWPSLLTIPGFLQQFITPIVKVSKGPSSLAFYTTPEYTAWKDAATAAATGGKLTGWQIKYYKVNMRSRGVGVSSCCHKVIAGFSIRRVSGLVRCSQHVHGRSASSYLHRH